MGHVLLEKVLLADLSMPRIRQGGGLAAWLPLLRCQRRWTPVAPARRCQASEIMGIFDWAAARVRLNINLKFANWLQLPWRLCALAHPNAVDAASAAADCLLMFDNAVAGSASPPIASACHCFETILAVLLVNRVRCSSALP